MIAVVALATGCGGSGKSASSDHLTNAEFRFLVGSGATAQSQPVRDKAEQILDQRCMQRRGFKFIIGGASDADQRPYIPGVGVTRTEALAVEQRRQTGYHLYEGYRQRASGNVPPNDLYVRGLAPAEQARYTAALFGTPEKRQTVHTVAGGTISFPTDGCVAEGETKLYGSPLKAQYVLMLPGDLSAMVGEGAAKDGDVLDKTHAWSSCVRKATGRTFKEPHEIVEQLQSEYGAQGPTTAMRQRETSLAVTDARCSFRSGLAAAYGAAFRREADRVVQPVRRLVVTSIEAERHATQIAERTVASYGGA